MKFQLFSEVDNVNQGWLARPSSAQACNSYFVLFRFISFYLILAFFFISYFVDQSYSLFISYNIREDIERFLYLWNRWPRGPWVVGQVASSYLWKQRPLLPILIGVTSRYYNPHKILPTDNFIKIFLLLPNYLLTNHSWTNTYYVLSRKLFVINNSWPACMAYSAPLGTNRLLSTHRGQCQARN